MGMADQSTKSRGSIFCFFVQVNKKERFVAADLIFNFQTYIITRDEITIDYDQMNSAEGNDRGWMVLWRRPCRAGAEGANGNKTFRKLSGKRTEIAESYDSVFFC